MRRKLAFLKKEAQMAIAPPLPLSICPELFSQLAWGRLWCLSEQLHKIGEWQLAQWWPPQTSPRTGPVLVSPLRSAWPCFMADTFNLGAVLQRRRCLAVVAQMDFCKSFRPTLLLNLTIRPMTWSQDLKNLGLEAKQYFSPLSLENYCSLLCQKQWSPLSFPLPDLAICP